MLRTFKIPRFFFGAALGLVSACLVSACAPPGDGVQPPFDRVYFPVSLAVSEDAEHLFIVNSDFDLQYAQGTIQSLDLARVRELSKRPCSEDSDCEAGELCDTERSKANDDAPSFFCVSADDPRPCGDLGEKTAKQLALAPGRCNGIDLGDPFDGGGSLLVDVAETSAFATQGLLLRRPCREESGALLPCGEDDSTRIVGEDGVDAPERLFVPVRGDTTVHFLDVTENGRFICGRGVELAEEEVTFDSDRDVNALRCSSSHRIDDGTTFALTSDGSVTTTSEPPAPDEEEDERDDPTDEFRLPPEPFDLSSSSDGRVVVVSHQLDGKASTLVNSWTRPPELVHILTGLDENPIGVAHLPARPDSLGSDFLLSYRSEARVDLLRFHHDGLFEALAPGGPTEEQVARGRVIYRPTLAAVGSERITLNSVGTDSRGIFVDSGRRDQALVACDGDETCIDAAYEVSLDVYVANRTPNSLLIGRTGGSNLGERVSALPEFHQNIPLTAGPSRIVKGDVINQQGEREARIFILCFDSALIYVFDPAHGRIEAEIRTGRGPYAMAFDPETSLAFVAHFTDSHVGVVSLDQRHPTTFGTTLATLGDPSTPRATK